MPNFKKIWEVYPKHSARKNRWISSTSSSEIYICWGQLLCWTDSKKMFHLRFVICSEPVVLSLFRHKGVDVDGRQDVDSLEYCQKLSFDPTRFPHPQSLATIKNPKIVQEESPDILTIKYHLINRPSRTQQPSPLSCRGIKCTPCSFDLRQWFGTYPQKQIMPENYG